MEVEDKLCQFRSRLEEQRKRCGTSYNVMLYLCQPDLLVSKPKALNILAPPIPFDSDMLARL